MTITAIFGDMHNREVVVRDLFDKIGLIDSNGNRNPGFHTIQLGDLLSLGYGEQEAEFLKWVRQFIDEQLIGNHELPFFTSYPDLVAFQGMEARDIVAEQMIRSEFNKAYMLEEEPNLWKAATHVGKWLITHAGLSVALQRDELKVIGKDAEYIANLLNTEWRKCVEDRSADPLFLHAGEHNGGIFWHRLNYLRAGYQSCHVPQIVGHTPWADKMCPPAIQNKDSNLWCIDTPGGCAVLLTEDDGETFELVQSDYEVLYGAGRVRGTIINRHTKEEVR